ncbi:hypothetical protein NLJ89_g8112 [Agrocybe chaxingu]|uniref:Thioesterase domain-containing protein n=1 Tax=Agrocybe chaxingu TaxID=84603 RepID=A0A9W8JVI4_9AGAR|nr:hypothetical protein NLJ89_g8112 [Agrocybe chaxingu]
MANSNPNNDADIAHIAGNAPAHVKRAMSDHRPLLGNRFKEHIPGPIFFEVIQDRFRTTEVSIVGGSDGVLEARVVVELDVEEDMLNGKGEMHTGCSASLIDMGSTLPLHALAIAKGIEQYVSVSQTMNVMYHSPARLGDKLKLINTTIILEGDAHSAKTEIWNASRGGLVASGSQIKMVPSRLPPQKL